MLAYCWNVKPAINNKLTFAPTFSQGVQRELKLILSTLLCQTAEVKGWGVKGLARGLADPGVLVL